MNESYFELESKGITANYSSNDYNDLGLNLNNEINKIEGNGKLVANVLNSNLSKINKIESKSHDDSVSITNVTSNNNRESVNENQLKNKNKPKNLLKLNQNKTSEKPIINSLTRNILNVAATNSRLTYTNEDTEENYVKTELNVIESKRKINGNSKPKVKTPMINLSKDLDNFKNVNEKKSKNFTPIKIYKRQISKTPEKDKSKIKEKSSFLRNVKNLKIKNKKFENKEESKRENSISIFKGPVNKEFFDNAIKDNGKKT